MNIDIKGVALPQLYTEVGKGAAGEIIIQQSEGDSYEYQVIEIQPYFLPTFVSMLQKLITPEAVG